MAYDNRRSPAIIADEAAFQEALLLCLARVFVRMFAALMVTAVCAVWVVYSPALQQMIFGGGFLFAGLIVGQLALVVAVSAGIRRLSTGAANALFFLYAALNGLTLSVVFFAYDLGTVYLAFGVTALMFAATAGYGILTRRDLTSIGSLCFMGLFGIIIASLANLFLRNPAMDYFICYAGVLIFTGLTAYDAQRIKNMLGYAVEDGDRHAVGKISVIGALTLYLDFINLFLKILRLLGRRR
jgi:hypothetical protein